MAEQHRQWIDAMACPVCQGVLQEEEVLSCLGCQASYPITKGVPWLFEQPRQVQWEWALRWRHYMENLEGDGTELKILLRDPSLLPSTQNRLRRILQATVEHRKELEKLLGDFLPPIPLDAAQHQAVKSPLPEGPSLMGYYPNLHRDWVWGGVENSMSIEFVGNTAAAVSASGDWAVFGAGGSRLAVDWHNGRSTGHTYAVDINPLFFAVVSRLLKGRTVSLHEFPVAPTDGAQFAVERRLTFGDKVRNGFHMLLADAMNPTFKSASLDGVLTPWLVDVVPQDTRDFLKRINRVLKVGGAWIHFGTLVYSHKNPALCYSLDEVREAAVEAGFVVNNVQQREIPYLQSPASAQRRFENVTCLVAIKERDGTVPPPFDAKPTWLKDHALPVPLEPFHETGRINRTLADVLAPIDGQKSISSLAPQVAQTLGLSEEQGEAVLTQLLGRLYQDKLKHQKY